MILFTGISCRKILGLSLLDVHVKGSTRSAEGRSLLVAFIVGGIASKMMEVIQRPWSAASGKFIMVAINKVMQVRFFFLQLIKTS